MDACSDLEIESVEDEEEITLKDFNFVTGELACSFVCLIVSC